MKVCSRNSKSLTGNKRPVWRWTLNSWITTIRSAEDRKIYMEGQLATVKPDTPLIGATGERVMAPADRLKALEVSLADLQSKFSDDHPDIRKVRREIAELKKMVGQTGGSAVYAPPKAHPTQGGISRETGKIFRPASGS